jgi:hypothetical protein
MLRDKFKIKFTVDLTFTLSLNENTQTTSTYWVIFYFFSVCPFGYLYFRYFHCLYVIASIACIHPVYSAGVWTHNLLIMSHLPLQPDHGSSP